MFLLLRVAQRALCLDFRRICQIQRLAGGVICIFGLGQLPKTRQHLSDLLFPLQEGGGQGPAVGLWVLYPQRLYILIVLPSQQQKLILLVEISDPSVHPVPRVGHLVLLLPQVHLISGNAVLEVFYLTLPLGQLFCKLLAGSLFLLHPFPLSLQIVFAQGRILGLAFRNRDSASSCFWA